MRIFYSLILFILSLLGYLGLHSTDIFAAPCLFTFSDLDCGYNDPPYCKDGNCTLSGGLAATNTAIDGALTKKPLSTYVIDITVYLLSFVSLVALLYIIYSGFQIMTGAGDEEKNKKAKNTIAYIAIGIVLIWLAIPIVRFIVGSIDKAAFLEGGKDYAWSFIIPSANAEAYSETTADTFREYQNKLRVAIQDLESELKINKSVNTSNIQNIKSLVQGAYDRLPDFGESGTQNDTMKRAVDRDLELALKNPSSTSQVGTAIASVASFISNAKIETIQGGISATPKEGNAPVTVSFEASGIRDPSGTTPDQMSYIWWMRENGGGRRELGRGKSLVYTFSQEGTYTVFLDVISGSRNSKKRVDVLPLTASTIINVKPRLGQIVLLVNGVNVSNLDSIKINPTIGKMGIIFDATASRATGGNIINTKWDFGNGNTISYDGTPIVERQIFANSGDYNVSLKLKTNNGQDFTKNLRLIVRNPSAVIQADSLVGKVGKEMFFSSLSYFTNTANVEYSWQIQDDNNKKIISNLPGNNLKYTFDKVGTYIITLNARSPNGDIDTDSKQITIESQDPIINLENPLPLSTESPNILVFDASKSFDPDTMSRKGLTYSWYLDGEKITLDNQSLDGAKGQIEFRDVGSHTVKLTVVNQYGRVSTAEKKFSVESVLSGNILITPRVAPIGTTIHLIGQSENADFFEWNMGDGSPIILGNKKIIQHKYAKTGKYDVTLTVTNGKTSESNSIKRRIHITDTGSPFAMIGISNPSNTAYYDPDACSSGATVVNRSDITTFDATKSINVDGGNANLTYTWSYFGKVKTTPTLTEKLTEIGCFPIKLTVRSTTTGVSHTSTEYIAIKNLPPEITSLTTSIDSTKKDSQKVLVNVTANGAIDPDGVITSYIWYYTTESDKEPQNIQITQTPTITFVLPNITEKYYFGVILEDNDGVRTNSLEEGKEQVPLIIDNKNGNIYMPLITLNLPKISNLVGESVKMSATAKTIIGTDITKSSEYAWDFDGDGKYDEKTTNPTINYTYKNSGTYSVKVRVTYNGVSNVKYGTVNIKNPLKANAVGYSLPDGSVYLMNTSEGNYDTATWIIDGESIESRNSISISNEQLRLLSGSTVALLRASMGTSDVSTYTIKREDLISINDVANSINYQTSPIAVDDKVHIKGSSDQLNISMVGNTANTYEIDTNINIDSDLDGIPDNDIDNKNHPSYTDGSLFTLTDISETKNRERVLRITGVFDGTRKSKDIHVIFDFIPETSTTSGEETIMNFGEGISEFDKVKLNELSQMIRTTESTDRIILMQKYNILIENWSDPFSKAKSLIDIQEIVNTTNLNEDEKIAITLLIDNLLVGDASSTDEVTIATKLIQDLIPVSSPNRDTILEKLQEISSHPGNLEKNKSLGKDILELIRDDNSIEDTYKIHIKNQLLIIINGGQSSVPENQEESTAESGSILNFISGLVKVFLYILGGILGVILMGYIVYVIGRKNDDIGFQDFVIDSVFHAKKREVNSGIKTPDMSSSLIINNTATLTPSVPEPTPITDPLSSFIPPTQTGEAINNIPSSTSNIDKKIDINTENDKINQSSIPSWLQVDSDNTSQENISQNISHKDGDTGLSDGVTTLPTGTDNDRIPETLASPSSEIEQNVGSSWLELGDLRGQDITATANNTISYTNTDTSQVNVPTTNGDLPDWLVDSIKTNPTGTIEAPIGEAVIKPVTEEAKKTKTQKRQQKVKETEKGKEQDADTQIQVSSELPDWLK